MAQLGLRSHLRSCAEASCSSTSGHIPASTGCGHSGTFAPGPEKCGKRLTVIGVHTPEFPFEREIENVSAAVKEMRVGYPVALDSDYAVWQAFANRYWPATYIADADGQIRHHQFGEGGYAECEMVIQRLLREAGSDDPGEELVAVSGRRYQGPGRLGQPGVARDLPRLRTGPKLRLPGSCCS